MNQAVEQFGTVDRAFRLNLRKFKHSPLYLGLSALMISKEWFEADYLSAHEISEALDRLGFDIKRDQIVRAFSKAKGKVKSKEDDGITKYKVMSPGEELIEQRLMLDHSEVVYIEAGKPFTGRRKLETIITTLQGVVRISDPYYGMKSLSALEMIPNTCVIRFLTAKTNENPTTIRTEIAAFKTQYPHIGIRETASPRDLHDRYIMDDTRLLLIGHGIKDIGTRESFIVQLDNQVAADIMLGLRNEFDSRWTAGADL